MKTSSRFHFRQDVRRCSRCYTLIRFPYSVLWRVNNETKSNNSNITLCNQRPLPMSILSRDLFACVEEENWTPDKFIIQIK